jgi:hypothetical protein
MRWIIFLLPSLLFACEPQTYTKFEVTCYDCYYQYGVRAEYEGEYYYDESYCENSCGSWSKCYGFKIPAPKSDEIVCVNIQSKNGLGTWGNVTFICVNNGSTYKHCDF